jgi:hypothetical protein
MSVERLSVPKEGQEGPGEAEPRSAPSLTVALLTIALLLSTTFQTFQLVRERGNLHTLYASQESPLQQAQRVRGQLDSIARRILDLAQHGNTGAATIVEQLARRGIRIESGAGQTGPGPTKSEGKEQKPPDKK